MSISQGRYRVKGNDTYENFQKSSDDDEGPVKKLNINSRTLEQLKKNCQNTIGDVPEIRRSPYLNTIFKTAAFSLQKNDMSIVDSVSGVRSKHSWKTPANKRLANALNHSENDAADGDIANCKNVSGSSDSDRSIHDYDKKSNNKYDNTINATEGPIENEVLVNSNDYSKVLEKSISSNTCLNRTDNHISSESASTLLNDGHVDYIMLFGLTLGLIISKVLHYSLIFFAWILCQVYKFRYFFIKDYGLMEFITFQETSIFTFRTKMWLLPIMAATWLFYIFVTMLQYCIKLLLKQVPSFLVILVHKIYQET